MLKLDLDLIMLGAASSRVTSITIFLDRLFVLVQGNRPHLYVYKKKHKVFTRHNNVRAQVVIIHISTMFGDYQLLYQA